MSRSHSGKRDPFLAGVVMLIAAEAVHRFEDFTENLTVWVILYRPRGGEARRSTSQDEGRSLCE